MLLQIINTACSIMIGACSLRIVQLWLEGSRLKREKELQQLHDDAEGAG